MPTFDTPEPISAVVELVVGDVRITASDRDDTAVEVRPSDESHEPDVRAAEQTRVEYSAGQLLVKAPRQRSLSLFGKPGSIDVTIGLPTGSQVHGDASVAAFRCAGRLGECRVKTRAPATSSSSTPARSRRAPAPAPSPWTGSTGPAEVSTGSGRVRLGQIDGTAVIKNSNGDSWIGEVAGDLRVNAANGDISVDHAERRRQRQQRQRRRPGRRGHARLGRAQDRASARSRSASSAGTAAWLDVHTQFGQIHNQLDASDGPGPSDQTVEVRARTSYGDIVIRRS